ncbi:putative mismatch-specific thymine-dna glycosylate [Diaporthe ampelina]|uniref:Putative mismatch-specific thymine-dna glycosylate n=1 Tax=Diaporthe ampelina TaxID=1214573 RepID=A0A0G2FYS6_9PEZI|nr:putative mismatch-specific thymine-dna glycosylate [Diaporthe ampelina]
MENFRFKAEPQKRNRQKSGYQPPSVYAHLPPLPDALAPNLLALFCGLNPGVRTAQTGHAYNHPSNLFWKLMYSSGVLPVRCSAEEDRTLPARFNLGLTNIVSRPSRNGAELSKAEMDAGVGALEAKVRRWRPEVVVVVGKSIWESVWRVRHGRAIAKDEFRYGWQDEGENIGVGDVRDGEREEGVEYRDGWRGARVFVSSSTSGLAATLSPAEKERIWSELGQWVEARRAGRDVTPGLVDDLSSSPKTPRSETKCKPE